MVNGLSLFCINILYKYSGSSRGDIISNIEKIKESLLNNKSRNDVFENSLVGNVFDIYEVSRVGVNHLLNDDGNVRSKMIEMYFFISDLNNERLSLSSKQKLLEAIEVYSEQINMVDFDDDEEVDFILKFIKGDLYNKFDKEANESGYRFLKKAYDDFCKDNDVEEVERHRFRPAFVNYKDRGLTKESLKQFVK